MNRAERRRLEKAQAKVHVITHDDMMYHKGFEAGMRQGIISESGMSTRLFTTCLAAVLHDEFGFGKERLDRVLTHVSATLETIQSDHDHERKIREWVKRETGIDLDDYTGGRNIELRERIQKEYDMGRMVTKDGKEYAEMPEVR